MLGMTAIELFQHDKHFTWSLWTGLKWGLLFPSSSSSLRLRSVAATSDGRFANRIHERTDSFERILKNSHLNAFGFF